MRSCEGLFRIDTGSSKIDFTLINVGGNHCQIANNGGILFDGYILEGYEVFEKKAKEQELLAKFAGWEFTRIK
ncbi:MAG: hypothetical protein J6112_03530 [Clostridia bacterium]|nr:hypothetical protein [Clostridia bacterium]